MKSARCPTRHIGNAPQSTPRLFLAGAFLLAMSSSAMGCSLYAPSLKDYARMRPEGGGGPSHTGGAPNSGGSGGGGGDDTSSGGEETDAGGNPPIDAGGDAGAAGAPAACIAQPEICNGLDDDCDGAIDNGCPASFLRGSTVREPVVGDSTGGSTFADLCANDELIVGIQIGMHSYLGQVTAICQKYTLEVNTRVAPYVYSVAVGATHNLVSHPGSTDNAIKQLNCAAGSFLVGMQAEEQSGLVPNNPNPELTSISIRCAVPAVDASLTSPVLDWTNTVEVGPIYGALYDNTKATLKTNLLAMNRFTVGLHGASGFWVDNVGMTSGSIQVLLQ